jgi:iron complex outermembrane receptor protein
MFEARDSHWLVEAAAFAVGLVTVAGGATGAFAEDAPAASSGQLEEITVTAERREETAQKAPIAISVVSAQELVDAGVNAEEDLTRLVPALSVYQGGQGSIQASIRGVGNLAGNTFAEQAIAFSYDGVYIARGEAIAGNLFDLDRVEVLKGPQGTLYGRNTNAGAVNLIARAPVLGQWSGDGEVDAGNYSAYKVEGALNVPLGGNSALRLAGQKVYHDGYLVGGYDDQDETDGRATWLWKPTDDVSVKIGGNYTDRGGKGSAGVQVTGQNGDFLGPNTPQQQALWTAAGFNPVQGDGRIGMEIKGIHGELDWITPIGTLTVLPAYLSSTEHALHYAAGFPVHFDQSSNERTGEVRLASPNDQTLTWVVGGYYFDESAAFTLEANQTSFDAINIFPDITTKSYAGFGQATWKLNDMWRLIGGARYTREDKTAQGETTTGFSTGYGPPAPPGAPACVYLTPTPVAGAPTGCYTFVNNSLSADKVTWRIGVEADVTETSMLYATVSTGFKAGGFYADQNGTFKPETLTAYTVGSKNRFLDNRLQFNVEAYYWKYKDKQVSHLGPLPSGALDLVTDNAGDATMYGLEPEVLFRVTSQDEFQLTLAYEHATYDRFIYQTLAPGPTGPDTCPTSAAGLAGNGAPLVAVNCGGFTVPNSPEWTATGTYRHTFELGNDHRLIGELSGHYRSSDISSEEQTASEHIGGFTTGDALLTYEHTKDLSVTAYVNNFTNKESYASAFFTGSIPSATTPVGPLGPTTLVNAPRVWGVRVRASF